jgi:hypothetical protein
MYDRLAVAPGASAAEVKTAYRKAALACHPDVVPADKKATAEAEFRRVAEAYSVLNDATKRGKYDAAIGVKRAAAKKPPVAAKKPAPAAKPRWAQPASSSGAGGKKPKRRPMVRKDADRVFDAEFGGQSIHDVLFSARYAARYGREMGAAGKASNARAEASTAPADITAQNVKAAARRFSELHPFVNPRDVKVGQWKRPTGLPGTHMPFVPFPGMQVPAGVTTELAPVAPPHTAELGAAEELDSMAVRQQSRLLSRPAGLEDAGTYGDTIKKLHRDSRHPHNMGVVYSYQRLY